MELFSHRKGLRQLRETIQAEEIDVALRNGIWNALLDTCWASISKEAQRYAGEPHGREWIFLRGVWADFFKVPVDDMPREWHAIFDVLRDYYFKCAWYEVYDFIEFIANTLPYPGEQNALTKKCNLILERELSAFRFIGTTIAQLTSEQEISEIDEALNIPDTMNPVKAHLQNALEKYSDRKTPDYRNSIKESISAVESLCNLIKGTKTTLGEALKEFSDLHPALKDSFIKLYGFTNDAHGIRHALLDESNLNSEDAKYMLVSCSAFINFLVSRSARQGKHF